MLEEAWDRGVQINTISLFPSHSFLDLLTLIIFVKIVKESQTIRTFSSMLLPGVQTCGFVFCLWCVGSLVVFSEVKTTALCPLLLTFGLNQIIFGPEID